MKKWAMFSMIVVLLLGYSAVALAASSLSTTNVDVGIIVGPYAQIEVPGPIPLLDFTKPTGKHLKDKTYDPVNPRRQFQTIVKANCPVNVTGSTNIAKVFGSWLGQQFVWPYVSEGWVVAPNMMFRPRGAANPYSDNGGWAEGNHNVTGDGTIIDRISLERGNTYFYVFYESQWNPDSEWWRLPATAESEKSFEIILTVEAA
jgi:hypothetical protein